jgi:hypothetical protein
VYHAICSYLAVERMADMVTVGGIYQASGTASGRRASTLKRALELARMLIRSTSVVLPVLRLWPQWRKPFR